MTHGFGFLWCDVYEQVSERSRNPIPNPSNEGRKEEGNETKDSSQF